MHYLNLLEQGWFAQLAVGAYMTLQISICSYFIGTAIGFCLARMRLSRSTALQTTAKIYVDTIRSVPELLLIFIIYYTGASAANDLLAAMEIDNISISAFTAAVCSLAIVQGGYQSEVIRGAYLGIPKGLTEAANSLGLRPLQCFFLVTGPLLLKAALPGLGNLWLAVLKESTLVGVVGYSELVAVGKAAAGSTQEYFFFYFVTALFFLAITAVSVFLIGRVDSYLSPDMRRRSNV